MNAVLAPKRDTPPVKYKPSAVGNVVGAFESETAAVFMRTAPVRQHIILYALVAILAISVVLAAIVKLDRVVTSAGRIVPTAGAMYVSPFDTGIVKQINVKAGDVVKKGQVLATLDPTFTHADLLQLQQKLASDEAAVARLEAELAGKKYKYSSTDPAESLQGGIWQKRQAEYQSNLDDFDGRIRSLEAQVSQYQADTKGYAQRLKAAQDVEKLYKPLLEKGYVSKLQAMQAADESTERARLLGDAQNQIKSTDGDARLAPRAARGLHREVALRHRHRTGDGAQRARRDAPEPGEGAEARRSCQPRCAGGCGGAQGRQGVVRVGGRRRRAGRHGARIRCSRWCRSMRRRRRTSTSMPATSASSRWAIRCSSSSMPTSSCATAPRAA